MPDTLHLDFQEILAQPVLDYEEGSAFSGGLVSTAGFELQPDGERDPGAS